MEHVESAPPLAHLPAARAAASAISACLRAPGTQLDNVEFANAVDTLAMKLADLDVNSGDVVAVLLPNRVEVVVTLFAAWYRGAALTPINPAQTDDEIDYQLKDSAASVIVGDARAADLAAGLGITYIDVESMLAVPVATNVRTAPILAQSDDHALIIYTSGTTGRPKGCVLDHANVNAMVSSVIAHCEFTAEDRSLLILPLFHMNGLLLGTLAALQAGGSVYIEPRFDPTTFWDTVAEYRPTYFSAVPTMFTLLNAESREPVDASSIRFAISGASPLAPALLRTFEDRFGFRVVEGYGLAETTVAVTINPVCGRRKVGTVGPPLPGQAISIVSPLGDPLPDGSVGEVVVFGPNVMRGYLGRPDDTAKVLRDRWLHTGDLGYLDEDGYLVLVDRIKEVIVRGGESIYPKELEDVFHGHADVLEACVIGRPDDLYGEVPVAYVVPLPGHALEPDALRNYCEERLARYKVPREINVLNALPKSATGKILKPALRAS